MDSVAPSSVRHGLKRACRAAAREPPVADSDAVPAQRSPVLDAVVLEKDPARGTELAVSRAAALPDYGAGPLLSYEPDSGATFAELLEPDSSAGPDVWDHVQLYLRGSEQAWLCLPVGESGLHFL